MSRVVKLVLASAVAAASGYGAALLDRTGPGRPVWPRFAFSSTLVHGVPSFDVGAEGSVEFSRCRWPDGRYSISPRAVATQGCAPLEPGETFGLMTSPIGGARVDNDALPLTSDVRFVRFDAKAQSIEAGPVLMEFGDYSGGARPQAVRWGSSIWLFDYRTESGSEVLRISATTGAVLQRTVMPSISRPVMSADAIGFWMGQAGNSFFGRHTVLGVWLAPIGVAHARLVRRTGADLIRMIPHGSAMDVLVVPRPLEPGGAGELWRFAPISGS